MNHNETVVKFPKLSQKLKPSSEDKPAKVRELQTLTITELDAISGSGLEVGGLSLNHNETIQKPKASSEKKPKELQTLTIAELNAIAGAGIGTSPFPVPSPLTVPSPLPGQVPTNHNETMVSLI